MATDLFSDGPSWAFPEDTPGHFPSEGLHDESMPQSHHESAPKSASDSAQQPKPAKTYPPRTCRICFEVVHPTYHPPSANLPQMLQPKPRVTYESADPDSGHLIRPCKCKGSSRHVHEGCLQQWRHADPSYGARNYWQCPTCGFKYRLERMNWGRRISSTTTQVALTVSILFLAMFLMGFIADPIINLYVDPYRALSTGSLLEPTTVENFATQYEKSTWFEHFVKGLASLGMLSFVKVLFALGPWQYWNLRSSGLLGTNRAHNNGRDRAASISWIVLAVGVGTFLWAVWKGVRAWSRRTLQQASERVMDVQGDEDEDEDEEEDNSSIPQADAHQTQADEAANTHAEQHSDRRRGFTTEAA